MATTTLSRNPTKITASGTTEHDIDVDALIPDGDGDALIDWISGASTQFNAENNAIDATSGGITTAITKLILPLKKGVKVRYKGGAGSEEFQITVLK